MFEFSWRGEKKTIRFTFDWEGKTKRKKNALFCRSAFVRITKRESWDFLLCIRCSLKTIDYNFRQQKRINLRSFSSPSQYIAYIRIGTYIIRLPIWQRITTFSFSHNTVMNARNIKTEFQYKLMRQLHNS